MKPISINHADATKELSRKLNSHYIKGWCEEWDFSKETTSRVLGYYAKNEDPWEVIRYLAVVTNAQIFGRIPSANLFPVQHLLR